ncbi:NACHT domain-containing protein [Kitasatospora aureofaciens]|uniref:NACHT domain-containing protein n=1 Tax=Kitasatospora aureofaciens TaxID=1894 RepID=UPI001C457397|nr:NACHT domain-containing protein [Kitasatospora aureofaciens]MBV6700453.1 NACHT domain-containing protein [Kitasatospora aureofaciens]
MGGDGGAGGVHSTNGGHNEFSGGSADHVVMAGHIDKVTITAPGAAVTPVDRAALELARMVGAQWRAEAGVRGLLDKAALPVRWTLDEGPGELATAGGLEALAEAYLALPRGRLVVLGGPGSGKSTLAVLLVLALLSRFGPGDRVPVLLSSASWDPAAEHLHAWLARRISEEYPRLLRAEFGGAQGPARLIEAERVLLVLDGLDELPQGRRAVALQRINESVPGDAPVILTSRAQEYWAAVREADVLRSATVARANPVGVEELVDYLRAAVPAHRTAQWRPVIDALRSESDGPLATALASPLMVGLLRAVHVTRPADPALLLDRTLFPDAGAVENHLLDSLVATAFPDTPPAPGLPGPRRRWRAAAAERWLGGLAVDLGHRGTEDIAWWQVGVPNWQRAVAAGLAGAVLGFVSVWPLPTGEPTFALIMAALGAGFYGDAASRTRRYVPHRKPVSRSWPWQRPRPPLIALVVVLPLALLVLIYVVIWDIGAGSGYQWVTLLMMPAPMLGLWAGALLGRSAASDDAATPPQSATRALRRAAGAAVVVGSLVTFAGIAAALLVDHGLNAAVAALLATFGMHAGLVALLRSQPGRYAVARVVLAARGQLPWRLTAFLQDAYRRGVLRQAGSVYQFRHARVRERLMHRQVALFQRSVRRR